MKKGPSLTVVINKLLKGRVREFISENLSKFLVGLKAGNSKAISHANTEVMLLTIQIQVRSQPFL